MPRRLFIERIRNCDPTVLAEEYLRASTVQLFPTVQDYENFRTDIHSRLEGVEHVSVVGTGNWRFSLNPHKGFKEFDRASDVDVAVISFQQFHLIWEAIRSFHRTIRWYRLTLEIRERLDRNALDIYSGFVSPIWIPDQGCTIRFQHKRLLNELSNKSVGHRAVKMLFFKNLTEAIGYYKRGFTIAKRKVSSQ